VRFEAVIRVLVASPSDLMPERSRLEDVIRELNLAWSSSLGIRMELVRWETHAAPAIGLDPQQVINEQLADNYDLFIGLMWARFGTPTGRAGSGTEEEFKRALERHKGDPRVGVMMYFKTGPIPPMEIDPAQLAQVIAFRKSIEGTALYWTFADVEEFSSLLRLHLSRQIQVVQQDLKSNEAIPTLEEALVADSEPEGEPGFLDLIESANEHFGALVGVAERIAQAVAELGTQMSVRAQQITAASTGDVRTYRSIVKRTAEDMLNFVRHMDAENPLLRDHQQRAIDAVVSAAAMLREFEGDHAAQVRETLDMLRRLRDALEESVTKSGSFRETIAAQPRVSVEFNRAKKRTVEVLDGFAEIINEGKRFAIEAEKVLEDMLPGKGTT
jgi:hypothetical protein